MASTRSKNTPGDYFIEQKAYKQQIDYKTNIEYGIANRTLDAGHGLIQGKLPNVELAGNPNDIESELFGIGSTNLVTPKPPVNPEIKQRKALSIVDRQVPLIMPRNLEIQADQRPFPIPK
jgi:hypothetical protein